MFIDLANLVAGWAAVAQLKCCPSSAFMGTVSGSSVANVASTVAFYDPMIKSLDIALNLLGLEAAASTGGQLSHRLWEPRLF